MAVTLICFAFFTGIALSRVGLTPMVGFLAAGFAYNFMGFQAPDSLQAVAYLGVTLLLFSIGLIVAALWVSQGFLSVDWLLVFAIAVSLSFAAATPFSKFSEQTYKKQEPAI